MPKINFKLSDNQKYDYLWALLNPNCDEEHDWVIEYALCDVYDDYALAFNYSTGNYERVYYTKNDETDTVELGEFVKVFVIDVTESEKNTLDTLRALNGNTYELVNENLTNAEKNAQDCAEFSTKIEEMNNTISTLNTEAENARAEFATLTEKFNEATEQNSTLSAENEVLKNYKKGVEDQHKEAVVAEYADKLSDEVIATYRSKFDEYSAEDLDMHLAYELKKTNASAFDHAPASGRLPKDGAGRSGVEEILARYKR